MAPASGKTCIAVPRALAHRLGYLAPCLPLPAPPRQADP